jgi:hypothetical protein
MPFEKKFFKEVIFSSMEHEKKRERIKEKRNLQESLQIKGEVNILRG